MNKNNNANITIPKIISFIIYVSYVISLISVTFDNLPLYEFLFKAWVLTYTILMYNLFIDKSPPKFLNINAFIEKREEDKYYEDYLTNLLNILNIAIKYVNQAKKGRIKEKDFNQSLQRLEASYNRIKRLKVPGKYQEKQAEILNDMEIFISELQE